jgi:hypothetical protein
MDYTGRLDDYDSYHEIGQPPRQVARRVTTVRCYFCDKIIDPLTEQRDDHHPDKKADNTWTVPVHHDCHVRYHSTRGEFQKWGTLSPYRGLPGLRLAEAAWPGFHRMGGLARVRGAKRDARGRFTR